MHKQNKLDTTNKALLFFLRNRPIQLKNNVKQADSNAHAAQTGVTVPKIDILASKKEFGNAIKRNRARRRILSAWRIVMKERCLIPQKNESGHHLNTTTSKVKISAKIGSLNVPFSELKAIIKKELEK